MTAAATEFPRSPVEYMKAAERDLGRSMTTLEAGEIYGAWRRAVPMDEIAAKIRERTEGFTCPACGDVVKREGLCVACDVFDADDQDIAPMTGRINYGSVVDPHGTGL